MWSGNMRPSVCGSSLPRPSRSSMGDVDVVIGNFQGAATLPALFASLRRQTQAPRRVIVVDAGSRDGSEAIVDGADAELVRSPNRGLGYLYNRGAEAADAAYVLLLNNDVAL